MRVFASTVVVLLLCFGFVSAWAAGESQTSDTEKPKGSKNPVIFWELACHDAEASNEFFKKIFDWDIELIPNTILYGVNSRNEDMGISGGIFTLQKAKLPFLTVYILVDDIEEKAKLVEENGGLLHGPPKEIIKGSKICLFSDPSGVTFAMLQQTGGEE